MGPIRLLTAPIRRIANSRLFQLAVVVTIILLLDHYSYDYAPLLPIADGLKKSVIATVELFSKYFRAGDPDRSGAAGRPDDRLCLCRLPAGLLPAAPGDQGAGRPYRLEQFPVAAEAPSRASAGSPPTAPGSRSSEYGRPTVRRSNGNNSSPGRPTMSRPIHRGRGGCCTA